jgi:hypothetical protein
MTPSFVFVHSAAMPLLPACARGVVKLDIVMLLGDTDSGNRNAVRDTPLRQNPYGDAARHVAAKEAIHGALGAGH